MEKNKEKQTIYKSLVELTEAPGEDFAYFTRGKIMEQIHDNLKKKYNLDVIQHRNGYTWQDEKIDLREELPLNKNLPAHLEELVQEGRANKVMIVSQGAKEPYEGQTELLYRAIFD